MVWWIEALHMLALRQRCPGACHAFRERGGAEQHGSMAGLKIVHRDFSRTSIQVMLQ